jgi:hypothetical protein
MKFATTFAAMTIGGLLPLAAASGAASAKVFDWSLTGTLPSLGGVPFPGSGTIGASPTESTGVWSIDTITGVINGSQITGTSTFQGADDLLFTNGFAFTSTVGISFETAAGQSINIFSFDGQSTPPTGNAYGELTSNPSGIWRRAFHPHGGSRSVDLGPDVDWLRRHWRSRLPRDAKGRRRRSVAFRSEVARPVCVKRGQGAPPRREGSLGGA